MTFICWGIFQGFFMILERMRGKKGLLDGVPIFVQMIICNILLMFSWTLFRSPSIAQAFIYWQSMLGLIHPAATSPLLHAEIFTPRNICMLLLCGAVVWQPIQAHEWVKKQSSLKLLFCTVVFMIAIIIMFTQTYNPFKNGADFL